MSTKFYGKNIFKEKIDTFKPKSKKKDKYRSREELILYNRDRLFEKIDTPKNFSLITNPTETINFINQLEDRYLQEKEVFVNMKHVEYMDYSAVTMLLSVVFSFKERNIKFNGNFPNKLEYKKKLIDSGFFDCLKTKIDKTLEYKIGKENQIFTRANKEVNSELGLPVMIETSETVFGEKRTLKGLQRVLLELMHNTNNHAVLNRKGEKHWWLSVNHDKENKKVSFIFLDYGIGIFESLKNKPEEGKWEKLKSYISSLVNKDDNSTLLKLLLEGEIHMTVTGKPYRGKGLPGIRQAMQRNDISELKIVSNDVFSNVSNNIYTKLNNEFSGTFVSWEINSNNNNLQWIL
ncbi:hypothetical protein FCR2A7T_29890 [Flavobacterium cauense R2A-7]|uniref:STAS domain-containing protein n=1 Tax=Flavobacterium cauense R2A-7 TaxID=1341154 RepID=V6RWI8_9FLAO|nr:hypothetical protein [Flavobacterium cauense]ESU18407.1 hypothetical protein FCR2A7T_29890 [Flavobacterium cauense R2A-7]KGO78680.1 hypothetical protein Q762_15030 [Flavobacterium cauense R2A-7]TWI07375.1 hypothetical protein IP98_02967 [Flavobacterium cauense R2A-7]